MIDRLKRYARTKHWIDGRWVIAWALLTAALILSHLVH